MTACARCRGQGHENEDTEYRDCQMCGGSGDAVPCWAYKNNDPPALCGRPSVAWEGSEPRCDRHDPG